MISFLTGELRNIHKESSSIELNVAGVGYEIVLPVFVLDSLLNSSLDIGQKLTLEIYFHSTDTHGVIRHALFVVWRPPRLPPPSPHPSPPPPLLSPLYA